MPPYSVTRRYIDADGVEVEDQTVAGGFSPSEAVRNAACSKFDVIDPDIPVTFDVELAEADEGDSQ